jgi:hypothetical protein
MLVELGTHWGVSYCAFCQAVKDLCLPTRCYAVDTWQGDAMVGRYGSEVLDSLKLHHDLLYGLFSELIRATFDEALDRFPDHSIDLLHIDGYHTYEAVSHDFAAWLPKMSSRGVMLFHDTHVRDQEIFGVWRLWDAVKRRYPSFEFTHSHGLGILAIGPEIPERIRQMVTVGPDAAAKIRSFFENLGDMLCQFHSLGNENEKAAHEKTILAHEKKVLEETLAAERLEHNRIHFRAVNRVERILRRVPTFHWMAWRGVRMLERFVKLIRIGLTRP